MTDAEINHVLATLCGYVYAGQFRARAMYHPAGIRTQVVDLPAYTSDWNLVLPLVLKHRMLQALLDLLREARDDGTEARRSLCTALIIALRVAAPTMPPDDAWQQPPLPLREGP